MNKKEKLYGGVEAGGTKFVCAVGSGPDHVVELRRFDTTTPDEAGLAWVVKPDKGDFVGRDAILRQREGGGPLRKLVGFRVTSRGIVRAGAEVLGDDDAVVGRVTSGGPAPTVGGAVGMAYVPTTMAQAATELRVRQRGKVLQAEQHKGPFYKRKS